MSEPHGADAVAPAAQRKDGRRWTAAGARERTRQTEGSAGHEQSARSRRGIQITWDSALRQMGELRVDDGGEVTVALNPDDPRVRGLRERRDCPGLVHIISAYVAQYAALSDANAKQVLRPRIVRDADPGLREHELYAFYYDRVDQPAVAHESES